MNIGKYLTLEEFCTVSQTYKKYADLIDPYPKNRQFNPELHHCLIYLHRIPHSGYDSQDIFEADC